MTAFLKLVSQVSHDDVAHGPLQISIFTWFITIIYHCGGLCSIQMDILVKSCIVILFIKSNDMKTHCLLNKLQKLFFSYLFTIRKYSFRKDRLSCFTSHMNLTLIISMITFLIRHEHSTWLTPVKNVPFSFIME